MKVVIASPLGGFSNTQKNLVPYGAGLELPIGNSIQLPEQLDEHDG